MIKDRYVFIAVVVIIFILYFFLYPLPNINCVSRTESICKLGRCELPGIQICETMVTGYIPVSASFIFGFYFLFIFFYWLYYRVLDWLLIFDKMPLKVGTLLWKWKQHNIVKKVRQNEYRK